jgi:hypothetical protein
MPRPWNFSTTATSWQQSPLNDRRAFRSPCHSQRQHGAWLNPQVVQLQAAGLIKDQVHLLDLLEVGLIDTSWYDRFPSLLGARLRQLIETRDREA